VVVLCVACNGFYYEALVNDYLAFENLSRLILCFFKLLLRRGEQLPYKLNLYG